MKTFYRTMSILNAGFVLGVGFMMWLYAEEIEKDMEKRKIAQ